MLSTQNLVDQKKGLATCVTSPFSLKVCMFRPVLLLIEDQLELAANLVNTTLVASALK